MKFNTLHLFGTAECTWILTVQNHEIQVYYRCPNKSARFKVCAIVVISSHGMLH